MKKVKVFQRGSGVYTCRDCKKQTRETGYGESDLRLCLACFHSAGAENYHSDSCHEGPAEGCTVCDEELGYSVPLV